MASNEFTVRESDDAIARLSRQHLEFALAIDTQSDENSPTIPSTEGQRVLADRLAGFFAERGATIERDANANVIAHWPGRGAGAGAPHIAMLVHLDTSKGTQAVPALNLLRNWDGSRVPYPENADLHVDVETYPATRSYLGQDLLFGPGRAPVGLDDKLGLAHLMTLADLLASNPHLPHPPLTLVGRPDEEIGRMAAVEGLAEHFAARGVRCGFTIDGILPYEVNVENFNAAQSTVVFPGRPLTGLPQGAIVLRAHLGGVNTHGCTAKEEGHRAATRFAAEVLAKLELAGLAPEHVAPIAFASNPARDCDGHVDFAVSPGHEPAVERAVADVVEAHRKRGASWSIEPRGPLDVPRESPTDAALAMLRFVRAFLASRPGFVLAAEDSEGYEGYSAPYRALPGDDGSLRLNVRLRDFDPKALTARESHVAALAAEHGVPATCAQQYVNMGPRMAGHDHLIEWPTEAARHAQVTVSRRPIRGGTGVDPFLDKGIPIANLGTGYFALESEKEFTSMQNLAGHARWLAALMGVIATSKA